VHAVAHLYPLVGVNRVEGAVGTQLRRVELVERKGSVKETEELLTVEAVGVLEAAMSDEWKVVS
jgi:hypothetical protein